MSSSLTLFNTAPTSLVRVSPAVRALPRWYAAYTRARHEKCVAHQLAARGVESYLPLYKTRRRWKDRAADVELPLFPGYVFLRIALCDRLTALTIPGIVQLVAAHGEPAALDDSEIERLRAGLAACQVEPWPYLSVGRRVRVRAGILEGLEGVLVRKKNGLRLVISVDLIMRSLAIEVDACEVEPVHARAA